MDFAAAVSEATEYFMSLYRHVTCLPIAPPPHHLHNHAPASDLTILPFLAVAFLGTSKVGEKRDRWMLLCRFSLCRCAVCPLLCRLRSDRPPTPRSSLAMVPDDLSHPLSPADKVHPSTIALRISCCGQPPPGGGAGGQRPKTRLDTDNRPQVSCLCQFFKFIYLFLFKVSLPPPPPPCPASSTPPLGGGGGRHLAHEQ